jgi:DNA-binding IclR family transcriptional regulator
MPTHTHDPDEGTPDAPGSESSVRVIDRVSKLLRALSSSGGQGASFSDLVREGGLGKATTHRLLTALADSGLVYTDLTSKRYLLGSFVAELGRNAAVQQITALVTPSIEHLAHETADTVFASVPEGSVAVCIARAVGSFPIRTLTLAVGDRRPLGVGSGSLALLAALPDELVARAIERNARWLRAYPGHTPAELERAVSDTRRRGFALNPGRLVPGMSAVAVAVPDAAGQPFVALAVAAIADRVAAARIDELVKMLKRESAALTRQTASTSSPSAGSRAVARPA